MTSKQSGPAPQACPCCQDGRTHFSIRPVDQKGMPESSFMRKPGPPDLNHGENQLFFDVIVVRFTLVDRFLGKLNIDEFPFSDHMFKRREKEKIGRASGRGGGRRW